METLLAQTADPQAFAGIYDLLAKYGPEGVFYLILTWCAWKYLPDILKAHLSFVGDTVSTQKQLANSFETLTERMESDAIGHARTHKAIGHMAEGYKRQTTDPEAKANFDRAIDALE